MSYNKVKGAHAMSTCAHNIKINLQQGRTLVGCYLGDLTASNAYLRAILLASNPEGSALIPSTRAVLGLRVSHFRGYVQKFQHFAC